jgi:pimeloyl-ACP methyl ester carboxylesterase/uncharacterized protein YjbI with pentapeptide repeats
MSLVSCPKKSRFDLQLGKGLYQAGKTQSKLRYGIHGDVRGTTPLVFIHGNFDDLSTWSTTLAHLPDETPFVVLEIPGFGKSKPIDSAMPTEYAAAVSQAMIELKLPPVVLVGHSLGGLLAAHVAQRYPEQVVHLVLVSAGLITPDKELGVHLRAVMEAAAEVDKPGEEGTPLYDEVDWLLDDATGSDVFDSGWNRHFQSKLLECQDTSAQLTHHTWGVPKPPMYLPLTAIWGAQDRWVPIGSGLEIGQFKSADPSLRHFFVLTDSGHLPHHEQPAALAQILATHTEPRKLSGLPACFGETKLEGDHWGDLVLQAFGGQLPPACQPPPPPTAETDYAAWLELEYQVLRSANDAYSLGCQPDGSEPKEEWTQGGLFPDFRIHCGGDYSKDEVNWTFPANVSRGVFDDAKLKQVEHFVAAEARFDGASMSNVSLAVFSGASMRDAGLYGEWAQVDFTGADLSGSEIDGSWVAAILHQTTMKGTILDDLSGEELIIGGGSLKDALVEEFECWRCTLVGENLDGRVLSGLGEDNLLVDSSLRGANLMSHKSWVGYRLVRVDLTGARIRDIDGLGSFHKEVELVDTICPDGTNSDDGDRSCRGHMAPASWDAK